MNASWFADKIEQWPTAKLLPYARNARTHSDDQVAQIAASIAEFGFTNPILAGNDGIIVAGHGRLAAAQKLGLDVVPVVVLDHLSATQRRALVIADNRIAENASWDDAMLRIEIAALQDDEFDVSLTGFDVDALAELMAGDEPDNDGQSDEDAVPEVGETPISRPGDVWIMGSHRLLCGDSTVAESYERLMQGDVADMVFTDPPYNVAYEGKTKDALTIKNDAMSDGEFRQFLTDAYIAADAVMKPGAVFYIWHADSEGYNFRGAAHDAKWEARQCLIWRKNTIVMGRQDYHSQHEPCLYGWKGGAGHLWASDRKQTTILEFDKPSRNGEHPTMKPVALFEYQMLNNTKGGDIVLDSFGGSGTTLIAAQKNGRIARLMELDPRYCDVIVRRWQEFTGQQAMLESDGRSFADVEGGKVPESTEA